MNRLKTSFISRIWSLKSLQQPAILRRNVAAPTYVALTANASSKLPQNPFFVSQLRSFSHLPCPDPNLEENRMVRLAVSKAEDMFCQRMAEAKRSGEYEKQKEAIINDFQEEIAGIRANWEPKLKMMDDWGRNLAANTEPEVLSAKSKIFLAAGPDLSKSILASMEVQAEAVVQLVVVEADKEGDEKEKLREAIMSRVLEYVAAELADLRSKGALVFWDDDD